MGTKRVKIKAGDRYGRLEIVEELEPYVFEREGRPRNMRRFKCSCDCGGEVIAKLQHLR